MFEVGDEQFELSYEIKMLRVDRTASEKKDVVCRNPLQAEGLASDILS